MNKYDVDDDVPPLEDMSELLHQAKQLQQVKEKREAKTKGQGTGRVSTSVPDVHPDSVVKANEMVKAAGQLQSQDTSKTVAAAPKPEVKNADSFGGMKKGFLFGPPAKSSKPRAQKQKGGSDGSDRSNKGGASGRGSSDIPLIKPQGDGAHNGAQRIPEVQEALKASAPFVQNKDWVTDDLLSKIQQRPQLARQLGDPRFSQAMAMFQTDPQAAMRHFQNNPDIQKFFQDFCGIMGDHFSSLGSSDTSSPAPPGSTPLVSPAQGIKVHDQSAADMSVASSTDPKQPTSADETRMREIMADPEVVRAFGDPRTRLLFEVLRTDPDKAQGMMETADGEFRRHIKTLVDKGLLGFAR